MKQKWFNYRPICLVFIFLLLGSLFAFYVGGFTTISLLFSCGIFIFLLIFSIIKKSPQIIIISVIAFLIGCSAYNLAVNSFYDFSETPSKIEARIYSVSVPKDGSVRVLADNCQFDGRNENANITIYIYDNSNLFEEIEIGRIISFSPNKFYESDLFYGDEIPNTYLYKNNLKYTSTVSIKDIEFKEKDITFAEKIKSQIKINIEKGLTNENAELAYSSLFGDKELLSQKQYNSFKLSGVAHLLAVSGLHVGIIVAVLTKLFKRCNKFISFFIISFFLLSYMYVCNFSVSVVRAGVMAIILLCSGLFNSWYDPLNSISIAGIIIFLMNPLCIFDASFLLSFSCVIGITVISTTLRKIQKKSNLLSSIIVSLLISATTMLYIALIMAYFFNSVNLISLIANVVLIPIFTCAFVIVFLVSILSLIIPMLSYLLYPINFVFEFINLAAEVLGNLPFANLSVLEIGYINIILYFIMLILLSRLCISNKKSKIAVTLPILASLLILM